MSLGAAARSLYEWRITTKSLGSTQHMPNSITVNSTRDAYVALTFLAASLGFGACSSPGAMTGGQTACTAGQTVSCTGACSPGTAPQAKCQADGTVGACACVPLTAAAGGGALAGVGGSAPRSTAGNGT